MTSKFGKNKQGAHKAQPGVSLLFLPHSDILWDLSLHRPAATWNLLICFMEWRSKMSVEIISKDQ